MTLEQQVHLLELQVGRLRDRIAQLEKDSHPPIDLTPAVLEVIRSTVKGYALREEPGAHL